MFPQHVIDYINSQRIGVLAVEMPDGSPHGATVHFAYDKEKDIFLFETYKSYRKNEALQSHPESRASFVIGVDESNMKTLQIDGTVRLINADELEWYDHVYFAKFPKKIEKSNGPEFVKFVFIPSWWRFTDWTNLEGKKIIGTDY